MKQSQVKPGVRALLSLGHRGAVAVTVVCQWTPERAGDVRWCVRDSSGVERTVTPRQLRPIIPGNPVAQAALQAENERFETAALLVRGEPGQTIDAGDVVIETTLHRLG